MLKVERPVETWISRCSRCKRVRFKDSDGPWVELDHIQLPELHIFTDGVCDPCGWTLYPGRWANILCARGIVMIVKLETLTKRGMRLDTLVKLLEHGHLRDVGDGKLGTTGPPSSWGAECYELWKAFMPHSGRKG